MSEVCTEGDAQRRCDCVHCWYYKTYNRACVGAMQVARHERRAVTQLSTAAIRNIQSCPSQVRYISPTLRTCADMSLYQENLLVVSCQVFSIDNPSIPAKQARLNRRTDTSPHTLTHASITYILRTYLSITLTSRTSDRVK